MKFLDRSAETGRLEKLVEHRAAGLAAVWGRRRVGKTRLLTEWCRRHNGVYSVADQSAESIQRRYFAEDIACRLPGFNDVEYRDWNALLRRLSADARAAGWKGPLVMDEFPHLVIASPSLPSVLQNWVDREAASDGLLVVISGSSQSMMQGLILDESEPLYGRALEAMALSPLPAGWIGEALGLEDPVDILEAYAVWGGIPRYWELAAPFGTRLDDAIDALALDPLGALHMETDRLLREETPSAASLRPLLDVIGNGCSRLSEIGARLGCPATSLGRPLGRLQELGLVIRETPFGESEKASRRSLYRIGDPFFAFWFRVVAPHRGVLAGASPEVRRHLWYAAKPALLARSWEILCRAAIPGLLAGTHPDAWLPASRWWRGSAPEWDLVLTSTDGRRGAVGEVKWARQAFDDEAIRRIVRTMASRPLPPGMPSELMRLVFVPAVSEGTALVNEGAQVITAAQVLDVLR